MDKLQRQVLEFHRAFGMVNNSKPTFITGEERATRIYLINEEYIELIEAIYNQDLANIADGIGDLLYVIYGTAVAYGIDMEEITDEIHKSNMTKQGGHFNEHGKYVKPTSYTPPNILSLLYKQSMGEPSQHVE